MTETAESALAKVKGLSNTGKFPDSWKNMDVNKNLYEQKQYEMKDYTGKAVPRVNPVTLNHLTNFANRVNTVCGGVLPQIKIRSKDMKEDVKDKCTNFLYGSFNEANNSLQNQGQPPFHTSLAFHGSLKKLVAMKVQVVQDKGGSTRFDIVPIDPRNFVYKLGYQGVIMGAYWTERSFDDIISQYPEAESKLTAGNDIVVTDYWDNEKNYVYADDELIFEQDNSYKYTPLVISPVQYDIFEHSRGMYDLMNQTATILMTTSMQSIKAAMELKTERQFKQKPQFPAPGSVNVTRPSLGEDWKVIQLPDVYQATAFMWNVLTTAFQHGTYAFIEYGGIEFPLSSLALTDLASGRDQVVYPLLQALTRGYQQACYMMMKQFRAGAFTAVLGEDEYIEKYTPGDLGDPGIDFTIKFLFKTTTISEEGAAYQMAGAARDIIPELEILEHIIKVDNPIETQERLWVERGYRENPLLRTSRMMQAFEFFKKRDEADLLATEVEAMLDELEGQGGGGDLTGGGGGGATPPATGDNGAGGGQPPPGLMAEPPVQGG